MYKNQLQELAQRSCFNLPSYACTREGPDHAPRFKASVNFNGEIFQGVTYSSTLRQAEHAAAQAALNSLSIRGPSRSLTARVLDETGVYKNLLQETAHRAGLKLPSYTTTRSGPGHVPVFTSTVELAGMNFTGEPAKTKKQAEKNAAIAAWSALKATPNFGSVSQTSKEIDEREDQEHAIVGRVLTNLGRRDESRVIRRRDHHHHHYYQPGNRTRRPPHRDNSLNTSSSSSSQIRWPINSKDPFLEPSLDIFRRNRSNFLSLLPPTPPRAASKILPPDLSKESQSLALGQTIGNLQAKAEESGAQLNNCIRDHHETSETKTKKPIPPEGSPDQSSHLDSRKPSVCGSSVNSQSQGSSIFIPLGLGVSPPLSSYNSQISTPRFCVVHDSQRFAPAVQTRSVIPVCASPPVATLIPHSLKETGTPSNSSPAEEIASVLDKIKL